jgi:lantibiotic modifying enzyme
MCDSHSLTRRQLLGAGLSAAAGFLVVPRALNALPSLHTLAPMPDVDVALAAERWIRRSRITTPNGVAWPADPLKPKIEYDLYNGFPGVIVFYLELYHATGDKQWLDEAKLGANELIARLPEMDAAKDAGLYTGLSGAAFVLEETARASSDAKYHDGAVRAIDLVKQQAKKTTLGAMWTGPSATNDIISGSAGIGLTLLYASQAMNDSAARTLAMAVGRELIDVGIPANNATKWAVGKDVKVLYPNFSHGTAGVAYFLASLYKMSGDRQFVASSLAGGHYLESIANTENGGFKIFHHEPGGENLYYMSWCHGPAGTARLFQRLAQLTGRARYNDIVHEGAKATIDSGAPEKQSPGFWNNVGQCCGNAGIGEFFLVLQRDKPNAAYASMIDRVKENTLSRATKDGDGLKWIQAENRVSPQDVVAQTGYMQGAAGIGSFFLHADALAKGRKPAIIWPDSPMFEPCVAQSVTASSDMSVLSVNKRAQCP